MTFNDVLVLYEPLRLRGLPCNPRKCVNYLNPKSYFRYILEKVFLDTKLTEGRELVFIAMQKFTQWT